jgi:uncharacterized membrane protein
MKSLTRVIRTTLVGGVLFLVPIIVLVLLVGKALQITHKLVAPLTAHLAAHSVLGIEAPRLAAICVLILVCFLAGVLARTTLASNTTSRMEDSVLAHLPGYDFLKSAVVRALTPESAPDRPIVLARVEDSWQIGALVERIDDGHVAVFVPGTPDVKSGAVYLMGTLSLVAPPPTSRKLAGSPPCSLIRSMVAIARPAPLTMHAISPSSET